MYLRLRHQIHKIRENCHCTILERGVLLLSITRCFSCSNIFKIAEVVLVFKRGDPEQSTNYRPISLLLQLSKILEKMPYKRIYSYPEKLNLLNEHQFRFRKKSSTIHAMTNIYDNSIKNIEKGLYRVFQQI